MFASPHYNMLSYLQTKFSITLFDLYKLLLWVFNQRIWYFQALYKNTSFDKEEILESHKLFMSLMNIPINEEYDDLHTLYWITKHLQNTYIERYIAMRFFDLLNKRTVYITMTKKLSVVRGTTIIMWQSLFT
jgi:hypothetical protein